MRSIFFLEEYEMGKTADRFAVVLLLTLLAASSPSFTVDEFLGGRVMKRISLWLLVFLVWNSEAVRANSPTF